MLREKSLREEKSWENLIERYAGNPLWLKIVSTIIGDLFEGSVLEFLKYDPLLLTEELKDILSKQIYRLSPLEKGVISRLANEDEPVAISKLMENYQFSISDLLNTIQSLRRRSLIEKREGNGMIFAVQPVLKQFLKAEYLRGLNNAIALNINSKE